MNYLRAFAEPDRLIHTEGTIISEGDEGREERERIVEPADCGSPLLRSATSLKRTIFLAALQFVGSRTEDECHEASRRIPFKQTFRNSGKQAASQPATFPSFSSSASSLAFPCYFNCRHSTCHRSVSSGLARFKRANRRATISLPPSSIQGMITVRGSNTVGEAASCLVSSLCVPLFSLSPAPCHLSFVSIPPSLGLLRFVLLSSPRIRKTGRVCLS